MLSDAASRSKEMLVLENMDMDVFDYNSIRSYHIHMRHSRPAMLGRISMTRISCIR